MIIDRRFLETRWWGPPAGSGADARAAARGARLRRAVARLPRGAGGGDRLRRVRLFALRLWRSDPVTLPRPMRYMHDEALEVLPRVLDAAGVRRAVLVGHSDGGSIAAIHAGTVHDPRVLGVVLIAAHFFVEDLNIASIRGDQGDLRAGRPAPTPGALSPRRRCGVPWLERRLARSAVPRLRHHGAGRTHPGAGAGVAGDGRPVRHRRSSFACWNASRRVRWRRG